MKKNLKYLLLVVTLTWAFTACKNKDGKLPIDSKTDIVVVNGEPKSIEELISDYQKANPNNKLDSGRVIAIFNKFVSLMNGNDRFPGKAPIHIQPIFAYGVEGVAYYEVWFAGADKTLQGWVLISATDKDYPIVNFSHGTPYSSRLLTSGNTDGKVYRFGVSYYTLEKDGKKVSEYGKIPPYVLNSLVEKSEGGVADSKDPNSGLDNGKVVTQEGIDFFAVNNDYESLKSLFPKYYFTDSRKNTAAAINATLLANNGSRSDARSADTYLYRWVSGNFGFYTQIPANSGFNPYPCWSGCVNNAWTSMFGWWDRNMAKASLIPTTSGGETSPIYNNTAARRNSVDPVQMYVRSLVGTYCGSGTGWTSNSNVWKGYGYVPSKGYGWSYSYQWCNSAGCNVNLANIVTDGIANNYRPVHVCANSHAYVGYGWAQWDTNTNLTWAYCYPGWNIDNRDDVWIIWNDFTATTKLFVY